MDYHFQRNFSGQPEAQFSMDHEAMGIWLTDELGSNRQQLEHLLQVVDSLEKGQRWEYFDDGNEYRLHLTRDRAEVRAALLDTEMKPSAYEEHDEMEELDYYDNESISHCGLDDFKTLLLSWQNFLTV
ncbi:YacL family protein [Endozoicomonas sp.]|uniref:UPF0231 family protein n=1 Tax=Endozoicomonas sp. TaxID=1892382 RepID=UPI002886EF58|nr:YacL family protein [Endozoicomonas sp.]